MRDRLQKFMEIEKLTSSRLAEILGVQPSNISHILGGRNKPSFEFVEKMLLRFPKVNPDWLLLGKGPVYRPELTVQPPVSNQPLRAPSDAVEQGLPFLPKDEKEIPLPSERIAPERTAIPPAPTGNLSGASRNAESTPAPSADLPTDSEIDRIVIFFKNNTCISYRSK